MLPLELRRPRTNSSIPRTGLLLVTRVVYGDMHTNLPVFCYPLIGMGTPQVARKLEVTESQVRHARPVGRVVDIRATHEFRCQTARGALYINFK